MKRRARAEADIERDPFREHEALTLRWSTGVLGAHVVFSSNRRELLALARQAFADLPRHRWPGAAPVRLRISLHWRRRATPAAWRYPPKPQLGSGGGLLMGCVDPANFVIIDPAQRRAVVQVDQHLMRHARLLRQELIEFAAITLATRTQGLVALHAGCVGARGKGVLLLGSSGAGKSTLTLQAALAGLDFLAEDSVFVQPESLLATGIGAFVHARAESVRLVTDAGPRRALRRSPTIVRRSGARKREFDLRRQGARLARRPLRIVAVGALASRSPRGTRKVVPITREKLRRLLRAEQRYAQSQPGWRAFEQRLLRVRSYRLPRVAPADAVTSLRRILEGVT